MSDALTIISNGVPRDVIDAWELTPVEREQFDYVPWHAVEEGTFSASFVRYKGELIDLGDLERWESSHADSSLKEWDCYRSDSFFSGIVVRYVDDFERVIVGRYYA